MAIVIQEGGTVCQECDSLTPFTGNVQTTSEAGCWGEEFGSVLDIAIGGL